ncbi:VOC family protein [Reichenbachiella ulvae]|uniref:VOC family protein n=1 Tax=Reichenbachiella ulvae TaxID=2980104 RepID=A0ABT3CZU7_9BACT|nr:VOC family protein [Reichenbachiella ulvae]MCV9389099.1 VOC family protein [Reichenbachiella ulvae]
MNQIKTHIHVLVLIGLAALMFQSQPAFSQTDLNELRFTRATLIVRDLKTSAAWYRKFLQFKIEEYRPNKHVKMRNNDFQLILTQGNATLLKSQIRFKEGKKYINGITKIGFDINQFDSLHLYLERYEQKLAKDTYKDKNLSLNTFIAEDPDGNLIQFFDVPDNNTKYTVTPSFFTIQSSDYINTLKWYTSHLGFEEIEVVDDSNIHYQNFLKKDDITLELIHLPYESMETTEFMPVDRDLAMIEELTFKIGVAKNKAFELDNNGNKIVYMR